MAIDYNFKPKGSGSDLGWYSRGYLPHFDAGKTAQFFTFRLFDSLPAAVVEKFRTEMHGEGLKGEIRFRRDLERYLDSGYGECFLSDARVAGIVRDALLFHAGKMYTLASWVIMPNHTHFVASPKAGVEIRTIAHSIKSYTAHEANKVLGRTGQFWQHEPFDRYIRDQRHCKSVIRYIERNPVKAGLCSRAEDWRFSSAWRGED